MNMNLEKLLNKEFLSIEELETLEQLPEVDEVQFNGLSGYHYNKLWYTILLRYSDNLDDYEEYDIYVYRENL